MSPNTLIRALADATSAKTEALCKSIVDNRRDDPWGGDGYLSTILRTVKMHEATEYSSVLNKTEYEPALDYSTSAHKELLIKEQSAALVGHVRVILLKKQCPQLPPLQTVQTMLC